VQESILQTGTYQ